MISLSALISVLKVSIQTLFNGILFLAGVESIICILQYAKIIPSLSQYFAVTGSWQNPNVTALFLVMVFPVLLKTVLKKPDLKSTFLYILVGLVLVSLLLLKCRTAFIGIVLSLFLILHFRYNLYQTIQKRNSRVRLYAFWLVLIVGVAVSGYYLYRAKQGSTDGRKLVWKISTEMALKHPLLGIGLGRFEHDYNLEQAQYFRSKERSKTEVRNAGYVRMAYNEILQNGVEGGIIAVLLFIGLFIILLIRVPKTVRAEQQEHTNPKSKTDSGFIESYTGVMTFMVMSMFNFTIEAIPSFCLFIIYVAILTSLPHRVKDTAKRKPAPSVLLNFLKATLQLLPAQKNIVFPFLIILSVYLFLFQVNFAKALFQNNQAELLIAEKNYSDALFLLSGLQDKLRNNEIYLENCAKSYYGTKNVAAALDKLNSAKHYSSNPTLYISIGKCYALLRQFDKAEESLLVAKYMQPNLLSPNYELARNSLQKGDTLGALAYAKNVVAIVPKIISKESIYYQQEANKIIQKINATINF